MTGEYFKKTMHVLIMDLGLEIDSKWNDKSINMAEAEQDGIACLHQIVVKTMNLKSVWKTKYC